MTTRRLLLAAACMIVAVAAGHADPALPGAAQKPRVAIFYYPWWGTPNRDGAWQHWSQNARRPPLDIASSYYPARGPYSSNDPSVVRAQMSEIARAGIGMVIVSWWGQGSLEDARLPLVQREAKAAGLRVAVHLEPWTDRTPAAVADAIRTLELRGIRDFFVYDSAAAADSAWAEALAPLGSVVVYANTPLAGKAKAGGFDGIYTYDVFVYSGGSFPRMCAQARKAGIRCAPSVGPGYDATRATGDPRRQPRQRGARYDAMWEHAIRSRPDLVTVTSYNEWHEGSQIEPAKDVGAEYRSYEGAYGLTGATAERAYLDRTTYWISQWAAALETPSGRTRTTGKAAR
jgi:glycoprotein endo-alpha-1,2-mannosidase